MQQFVVCTQGTKMSRLELVLVDQECRGILFACFGKLLLDHQRIADQGLDVSLVRVAIVCVTLAAPFQGQSGLQFLVRILAVPVRQVVNTSQLVLDRAPQRLRQRPWPPQWAHPKRCRNPRK